MCGCPDHSAGAHPSVHTTHEDRQTLLKYGKVIGRAIEELITIVSPATFYKWVREAKNGKPKPKNPKGGQRKPKELRELVLTIAEETGFGLTRIIGELRKLGITKISRQTVRTILKEHGIEPSPDRTSDSWADFLNRHGETLCPRRSRDLETRFDRGKVVRAESGLKPETNQKALLK